MNPIIRISKNTIMRNIYEEIWTPLILDNQTTSYLISNYGRIYSYITMKLLSFYIDKDGYLKSSLSINGRHYTRAVHRLVMMSFNPITDYENYQVNHINGNKQNNYIFNLEWCTSKQNINHAIITGLSNQIGENHHATYLTNEQIHYICQSLQNGNTYEQICNDMQIYKTDKRKIKSIIRNIENGNSWTGISKDYTFKKQNQHNIKYNEEIVHSICKYLELGFNYDRICKTMCIPKDEITDFKKFMYRLVSKDIFNHIKCKYEIKIPLPSKQPLFTDKQIHEICMYIRDGFNGKTILEKLNIDFKTLDKNTKHSMINCISNIKKKKTFKNISDKYF